MRILAIETSCDETGIALLNIKGGLENLNIKVEKELLTTQFETHRPYGGVVPGLAKREHENNLPILFNQIDKKDIDLLAVTVGPGLDPCLWAGINFVNELHSKELSSSKLIGVNHMEGHLYSFLLSDAFSTGFFGKPQNDKKEIQNDKKEIQNDKKEIQNDKKEISSIVSNSSSSILSEACLSGRQAKDLKSIFPAAHLVVSGGHTMIVLMESMSSWKILGQTRDDAAGEAFDKVARMIGLFYPGGPEISKLAKNGNPESIEFPRPMINSNDYDFSFSGLKTSVLYHLKNNFKEINSNDLQFDINEEEKSDIAASFQKAVIDTLTHKTFKAVEEFGVKSVMVSGGVAANELLVSSLSNKSKEEDKNFFVAPAKYNTDNGVMIGLAGYINYVLGKNLEIESQPNLSL